MRIALSERDESEEMAAHRIPVLGWPTVPNGSGEVFFEPYDVKASNDAWKRLVLMDNPLSGHFK